MRAVVQTEHGGPEVLQVQEKPDPPVGPGEVRIAVKAAGINFADTMARVGLYPEAPKPPCVVGYEVAGEVESLGEGVDSVKVGDRVMAGTRFGGQASMVTVAEDQVIPLQDSLSYEQGAAFPVNYATSYAALVIMGGLREGERVLIHAAAGGVGISATQIARSRGAEIFGTASGSKHDAIRAQGVEHAIDYRTQDFEQEVRRITGGEGIDLVMDATGPTNFRKDYRLLRDGGRLIMYGASELSTQQGRSIPTLARSLIRMPLATMPWWKSLSVLSENKGVFGLNMLAWQDHEGLDRVIEPLSKEIEAGTIEIDPVVAEAFPFDRAADAHRFIAERRNIGKVVLVTIDRDAPRETESRPRARAARGRLGRWARGCLPPAGADGRRLDGPRAWRLRRGLDQRPHAQRPAAHRQPDQRIHVLQRAPRPDRSRGPGRPRRRRTELRARQRQGGGDQRHGGELRGRLHRRDRRGSERRQRHLRRRPQSHRDGRRRDQRPSAATGGRPRA